MSKINNHDKAEVVSGAIASYEENQLDLRDEFFDSVQQKDYCKVGAILDQRICSGVDCGIKPTDVIDTLVSSIGSFPKDESQEIKNKNYLVIMELLGRDLAYLHDNPDNAELVANFIQYHLLGFEQILLSSHDRDYTFVSLLLDNLILDKSYHPYKSTQTNNDLSADENATPEADCVSCCLFSEVFILDLISKFNNRDKAKVAPGLIDSSEEGQLDLRDEFFDSVQQKDYCKVGAILDQRICSGVDCGIKPTDVIDALISSIKSFPKDEDQEIKNKNYLVIMKLLGIDLMHNITDPDHLELIRSFLVSNYENLENAVPGHPLDIDYILPLRFLKDLAFGRWYSSHENAEADNDLPVDANAAPSADFAGCCLFS